MWPQARAPSNVNIGYEMCAGEGWREDLVHAVGPDTSCHREGLGHMAPRNAKGKGKGGDKAKWKGGFTGDGKTGCHTKGCGKSAPGAYVARSRAGARDQA